MICKRCSGKKEALHPSYIYDPAQAELSAESGLKENTKIVIETRDHKSKRFISGVSDYLSNYEYEREEWKQQSFSFLPTVVTLMVDIQDLNKIDECRTCKKIDELVEIIEEQNVNPINSGDRLFEELLSPLRLATCQLSLPGVDIKPKLGRFAATCLSHGNFSGHINVRTGLVDGLCPECLRLEKGSIGESLLRIVLEEFTSCSWSSVRPDFLKNPKTGYNLELDCYNRKLNAAFEFQGRQHYEPIEFFGGEETFVKQVERDELKTRLCELNDVKLFKIDGRRCPKDKAKAKSFLLKVVKKVLKKELDFTTEF